jgi:hypothetical protein
MPPENENCLKDFEQCTIGATGGDIDQLEIAVFERTHGTGLAFERRWQLGIPRCDPLLQLRANPCHELICLDRDREVVNEVDQHPNADNGQQQADADGLVERDGGERQCHASSRGRRTCCPLRISCGFQHRGIRI